MNVKAWVCHPCQARQIVRRLKRVEYRREPGIEDLVERISRAGHSRVFALDGPGQLPSLVWSIARPGDVVVCLGAGNITAWAHALPGQLQQLAAEQAGPRVIANDSGTAA